jgi:hypothetical protein
MSNTIYMKEGYVKVSYKTETGVLYVLWKNLFDQNVVRDSCERQLEEVRRGAKILVANISYRHVWTMPVIWRNSGWRHERAEIFRRPLRLKLYHPDTSRHRLRGVQTQKSLNVALNFVSNL